jgi:hypothetical protein
MFDFSKQSRQTQQLDKYSGMKSPDCSKTNSKFHFPSASKDLLANKTCISFYSISTILW